MRLDPVCPKDAESHVRETRHARYGIVAVALHGTVAAGQRRAATQIVIGIRSQNARAGSCAVLADHSVLPGHQIFLIDVEPVRVSDAGAAAAYFPGGGDRALRASLGQVACRSMEWLKTSVIYRPEMNRKGHAVTAAYRSALFPCHR